MKLRIIGGWALCAVGAQAQTASNVQALPEVVVSGGLIEQKQFDAPASVQVIDGQRIRSSGPQVNLSDALTTVPGVVALNRNNYAQDVQISIRGFGARAAFGLRGIRLIADGIPATTPDGQGQASTVSLTSVDRIEVLTGPLAQIYGNAAGGVIQTFTREAGNQPEALTQLHVGSFGLRRSDWQLSGRTGQVGVVADYSTFSTNGYRDHSAARREQLNSVITLDSAPGTRHKFVVNLFNMPQALDPLGLTWANLSTPDMAGINAVAAGTRKTVHQEQVGWVMNHRIQGDLVLHTRLYRGDRSNLQFQASNTWISLDRQYHGWGLHLQGQHDGAVPVQWTLGLDADQSGEQRQAGASSRGQFSGSPTRNEWNQANASALFGQANWLLSDRWTMVTGARQSRVTLRSTDQYLTDADGSGRVTYQATNPVLGLTWHATPSWNVYAHTGRGFETPTLAETAYTTATSAEGQRMIVGTFNTALLASTSRHFEVGTKYAPRQGTRLNLALFDIQTRNEIVTDLARDGRTAFQNATRTHRQGLELSAQQLWGRHFRTDAALTAMRAIYSQSFGNVAANNRLPATPDRLAYLGVQWAQAGWDSKTAPLGWQGSLEWQGRSRIWANDANTAAAGGYGLVHLKVRHRQSWAGGSLEPYWAVDNLMDKKVVGSVIVNQNTGGGYYEPALPRNWVLGLQAKWAL